MAEVSIDEVIPRYVEDNPYKYSPLEKAERKKAIRDMARNYPTLPESWLDMVFDFWKHTPEAELIDIINSKRWEGAGRFSKAKGGIIKAMEVLDSVEDLSVKQRYIGVLGLDGEVDTPPPDPSSNV